MGRYYVNTTTDLIVGSPTSPTLDDPPTGAELRVIPDSLGALQGGTWDGTTYTAPTGQPVVYDTSTELGELQQAAHDVHDALLAWHAQVDSYASYFDSGHIDKAHDWLAWAHFGVYRVVKSTHWTIAQRLVFCQQMPLGAFDITTVVGFLTTSGATDEDAPTSAVIWVDPDTGLRVTVAVAIATSTTAGMNWEAGALTATDLANGAWIKDLAA